MLTAMRPARILKVAVNLTGLSRPDELTGVLFVHPTKASVRNEKLSTVVDAINGRYGSEIVRRGIVPETRAGHVGTKIAFTRVPDLAEFME